MAALFMSLLGSLRSAFRTRAELALENLALRQQLANLRHTSGWPRIRMADRAFRIVLSRLWSRWADVLVIVKPDTVISWHRAGFRLFWRWKSRSRSPAASDVSTEVKALILKMAEANVGWGAPRIHGELLKLGIDIGERSVSRFMPTRPRKPPSQTWRDFLEDHVGVLVSIDFFTVCTATFRVLYVFLVLSHDRRRVVHWNVTSHPGAQWTAQQIVEAFPEDTAPKYMIRDRDGIYGEKFHGRIEGMRSASRKSPSSWRCWSAYAASLAESFDERIALEQSMRARTPHEPSSANYGDVDDLGFGPTYSAHGAGARRHGRSVSGAHEPHGAFHHRSVIDSRTN
jgi:hypothetical protein